MEPLTATLLEALVTPPDRIAGVVFRPDVFGNLTDGAKHRPLCNKATKFYGLPAFKKEGQQESYLIFHSHNELNKYLEQ